MDKSMTELRSVTCHMGSHGVTCHPTQVSAPHLNPSHADFIADEQTVCVYVCVWLCA